MNSETPGMEKKAVKKAGGRPRTAKVDTEKAAIIIRCLEVGNYFDTAANIAGVHPRTARQWLEWGEVGRDKQFEKFYHDVKKAEATAEGLYLSLVFEAARDRGVWQAAAWYLERKHPDRWGKRDNVAVEVSGSVDVRKREVEAALANYASVIQEAEKILSELPGDNGSGE